MSNKPKFNPEHYNLLINCSKKRDMTEWNRFRKSMGDEKPKLNRTDFSDAYLKGANLQEAFLRGSNLNHANLADADLSGAYLLYANLSNATLCNTILQKVFLREALLSYTNLEGANLTGANLMKAILTNANLTKAILIDSNLGDTILVAAKMKGSDLTRASCYGITATKTDLRGATLVDTKLDRANFRESNLSDSNLSRASMMEVNFIGANLSGAKLNNSNLTASTFIGAKLTSSNLTACKLYGTSRDDWKIDSIKCDYVYWDKNGKKRIPKDCDFEPGEFEELYKSLPTITYYFSNDFTPITTLVMHKVVNSINQKHNTFDLRLDSFHSRSTPHAVFTVLHKDHAENALQEITNGYERTIQRLEGKIEGLKEAFSEAIDRPQSIRITHMGNTFNTTSGRDTNIATDQGTVNGNQDIINMIDKTVTESCTSLDDKEDAKEQLDKMTQELAKPEPDKGRIKRCYDYVVGVIPKVAEVVPWGKLIEKTLGL